MKKPLPPVFRDDTDASITSLFRKGYDSFRIAKMLGLPENRVVRITRALEMQKRAHPETFAKTTADRGPPELCPACGRIVNAPDCDCTKDEQNAARKSSGVSPSKYPAPRNEKKISEG